MSQNPTIIGDCTLWLGDCREILPTLGKVDAVVTDPPYGLDVEYAGHQDDPASWKELMDSAIPMMRQIAPLVVCFTGITSLHSLPKPDWIAAHVWRTTGCFGNCGINQWMPIAIYGKDIGGFGSVNRVIKSDVLAFSGGDGVGFLRDASTDGHPCPKPTNVMTRVVNRFSQDGETILDPFMGSGTTGVACVRTGRKFIGIEIEPHYHAIACKRIQEAYDSQALFRQAEPIQSQAEMFSPPTA